MNITDPIADFLTRIRNAQAAGMDIVSVPASKIKIGLAHLLKEEGFIKDFRCIRDRKQGYLKMALKYDEAGKGVIRDLQRVSKPSRRVYVAAKNMPYVKNGFGVSFISTSYGLMTDREAKARNIGGEYICWVY